MEQVGWERVAHAVRERRTALGLSQAATEGVSPATWTKLENARQDSYKPFLLANVERVLQWPPGTIERLVLGGEPPEQDAERSASLEARVEGLERRVEALEARRGRSRDR